MAWSPDPAFMASLRREFLAQARACFLDPTGATPLPSMDLPFPRYFADLFAADIADLDSLASQIAYLAAGRGPEDMSTYADMWCTWPGAWASSLRNRPCRRSAAGCGPGTAS